MQAQRKQHNAFMSFNRVARRFEVTQDGIMVAHDVNYAGALFKLRMAQEGRI